MSDSFLSLAIIVISAFFLMALFVSSIFVIFLVMRSSTKEKLVRKDLSSFKTRHALEKAFNADQLDDVIVYEDELDYLAEEARKEFLERQSLKFLECALNLMAHSYEDFEKLKEDVAGCVELAFEDEEVTRRLLKTKKNQDKDQGGDLENAN